MFRYSVGRTSIEKLFEIELAGFAATSLLPDLAPDAEVRHPDRFPRGTMDGEGHAILSVHSWLVRHEGLTILIDTGVGNGKSRPGLAALDRLDTPYLRRLAAAGVAPEAVDYVLHTHIHADHVGWNTRASERSWVPTFPNATVICSGSEWRYVAALDSGDAAAEAEVLARAGLGEPIRRPIAGVFADSMRPIAEAGRLRLVEVGGDEVLPGIRFLAAPGHSIDHAAIALVSDGKRAVFGGDVLHHPVEVYDTSLVSRFCEFPEAARASRRRLLDDVADGRTLYCSSHFPASSAGRVERLDDGYGWRFLDGDPVSPSGG